MTSKKAITDKKPDKKGIEKDCYDLWAKCAKVKQRTCRNCNSDTSLQGHHIRSRSHAATRFDLENALVLCSRCHCLQKFNPEQFQDRVIEVIGDTEYQRLKAKSLQIFKPTVPWLLMMKDALKTKLRNLEEDYGTRP